MKTLLSLDLSTTCTGWASFDIESKKLVSYGILKPSSKVNGVSTSKMKYPEQQLSKMLDLAEKIRVLILNEKPFHIVIEEIAGSRQRLGQKVLDGLHWIVLEQNRNIIPIVTYYDVSGLNGWRTHLKLRLSPYDKLANAEARKLNKQLGKGVTKLPIVDWKTLSARYANSTYGLTLDPEASQFDADIADAVSMGNAFLTHGLLQSKV